MRQTSVAKIRKSMNKLAENTGPLKGLRILDLTAVVMGPYATQTLGDLGADVIKVEPPSGDNLRAVGPMRNPHMGHMTLHLNRNKRSVVLDLKKPQGLEACLKLAQSCDALIYNVRPQAMARLGLSYDAVKAVNPKIVYVGAFGYGEFGPYAGKPAYDDLIQGAAGVPSLYAEHTGQAPRYVPVTIGDRSVGLQAAIALLSGVLHARSSGVGQAIEVTMFEALSQFVLGDHLAGKSFEPEVGEVGYARLLAESRKPYATSDGYVCALIYNDKHWKSFFKMIDREDMALDPKFESHGTRAENIAEVYDFVSEMLSHQSTRYWLDAFEKADIPVAKLNTMESLVNDEHLNAVGFFPEFDHPTEGRIRTMAPVGRYSATPPTIRSLAPRIGEHSAEVLREVGYDDMAFAALLNAGVSLQA
jgi:crotonobetainyl-CoA:carnitine CoA-transferase CaiB-like acyl-CoA transferase